MVPAAHAVCPETGLQTVVTAVTIITLNNEE